MNPGKPSAGVSLDGIAVSPWAIDSACAVYSPRRRYR